MSPKYNGEKEEKEEPEGKDGYSMPAWLITLLVITGVIFIAVALFNILNQMYIYGILFPDYDSKGYGFYDEPESSSVSDNTQNTGRQDPRIGTAGGNFSAGNAGWASTQQIRQHSRGNPLMNQLRRKIGQSVDVPDKEDDILRQTINVPDKEDAASHVARKYATAKQIFMSILGVNPSGNTDEKHDTVKQWILPEIFHGDSEEFEKVWNEALLEASRSN